MNLPLLPSLVGPTAAGKTAVAIEVAQRANAEILSADSRQIYRRMDIGTAKPTAEERAAAPHHLLDLVEPTAKYSGAEFGVAARAVMEGLRASGRLPFLVGGSGLYLRAAEVGLFAGPPADPAVRAELEEFATHAGDAALHERLAAVDPERAARLAPADRVRVVRALEVHRLTGIPLSEHHRRHQQRPAADRLLRFGLAWDPEALARRIETRVQQMLTAGWEAEVRALLDAGVPQKAPGMNALGYPEVAALVLGELAADEAAARIISQTRRFAKRQRTWFRAVPDVRWFTISAPEDLDAAAEEIAQTLAAARAAELESP